MIPQTTTSTDCPSDAELAELFDRTDERAAAERLQGHLSVCGACRAVVGEMIEGDAALESALGALPRAPPREPSWEQADLGFVAA
jgi:hypothetical protein